MGVWRVSHILKLSSGPTNFTQRWSSTIRRIDKLLIANRGEIACRVMRTARRLGVKTVAVYSDADQKAMHVQMADEAYHIGPASSQQSYLRGDKLLEVARQSQCQAIHPGYGFLSENVEFAEACQKNQIIFVGPPASAIRDMGIKSTSKVIMSNAGVPIIEGYHGEDQSDTKLKTEAARIGYPIMIKAVRGGGGKGMRIAYTENEFDEALQSARSESQKSFNDSVVLLERFVAEPRHVEVQVFADSHGNAVHLFERDCSVQRRHQKIIEEAPAPGLSYELRSELGAAAVRAARAVGYVGAGTVEFILDRHSHSFHFMEMNTRLQVEHPITEMITGTDLVEWQIKIASGERLPVSQDEIKLNGHAFEARIYAEDPKNGFLPGAGTLQYLATPLPSEDVRVETGVRQGDEVSVHYDPMIAKLVVWGNDRTEALLKMTSKLAEYNIAGLETNVNFLMNLCKNEQFALGNVHTNFIRDYHDILFQEEYPTANQLVQAAMAVALTDDFNIIKNSLERQDGFNPFIVETGFRVNYPYKRQIKLKFQAKDMNIQLKLLDSNEYHISLDQGKTWNIVTGEMIRNDNKFSLKCNINGTISNVNVYHNNEILALYDENGKCQFELEQPKFLTEEAEAGGSSANSALAPMPGVLDKILIKAGDFVKKGDPLVIIIAMKMEFIVKAAKDVKVSNVLYKVGDNVAKDAVLVQFEEEK